MLSSDFSRCPVIIKVHRLIVGPTISDRVVALDALTNVTTALFSIDRFFICKFYIFGCCGVYALLAFIGVVAVARYLDGGVRRDISKNLIGLIEKTILYLENRLKVYDDIFLKIEYFLIDLCISV